METLTPGLLLKTYRIGIFPMSEGREDPGIFWVDPDERGVLPLNDFHIPKRLARTIRTDPFHITFNTAFRRVMEGCAGTAVGRMETWINEPILDLYTALHEDGHAHSVECHRDGQLVGGLYGVQIGSAFFGESMFSRETDASKIALVHLAARLIQGGFTLLDTQFVTSHLEQFGAREIPRLAYMDMLKEAVAGQADFYKLGSDVTGLAALQLITQTS
jgi:leucyl/phenylalanyl-tRNA--protein transferase